MHTTLTSRTGATMVELMAVLAILGLGVAALLQTIGSGVYYAKDTENNIKAINIAREGIEGLINIRDTNWLRFSSDKLNCWNTKDYQGACIGADPSPTQIATGSYTIYPRNGVWYLSGSTGSLSTWSTYRSAFPVGIDANGFYTQTGLVSVGCTSTLQSNCLSIFSREIQVSYIGSGTGAISALSIVRWVDKRPRSVILETTLTNWKSNF